MRDLNELNEHRVSVRVSGVTIGGSDGGAFMVRHPSTGTRLRVIASSGMGWDHVSVSLPNRCPNWAEMSYIKDLFFRHHETAMQLHVPASEHINNHPYCLHLWRPHLAEIPLPPGLMVGVPGMSPDDVRSLTDKQRLQIMERAAAALSTNGAKK